MTRRLVLAVSAIAMLIISAALTSCGGGSSGGATSKTWGAASLLETSTGDAQSAQVAFDRSGNALAVWSQSDGTRNNIWANRYSMNTGTWGTPQQINTTAVGDANGPRVAIDGSGNAIVVWQQDDIGGGSSFDIWSDRYTAGTGWGTAALIETGSGTAGAPQIAIDGSGNALAVWQQWVGTRYNILANRYNAGTGWGTAAPIETYTTGDALSPQIAMNASGAAVAVWQHWDGTYASTASNHFNGGAWGTEEYIETNTGAAQAQQVAIDGSGNALAVWQQNDGTRDNIWANRYSAGSGWGTAALIETDNAGNADFAQIAFDSNGNALAVWTQNDGTLSHIIANRYTVGSGWGTAAPVETNNAGGADFPQIAMNASGSALAVWHQSDGTRTNIWANRYSASSGWGTAVLIETDNMGNAGYASVAIDANNNGLAVWQQSDGTRNNIWANRYQ